MEEMVIETDLVTAVVLGTEACLKDPLYIHNRALEITAQVEGLVTADVEILTAEERDILIDHTADDIDALGVGGIDGMVDHGIIPLVAGGLVGLQLAVLLPLGAFQQTVQVAEGGKGGNEIDKVFITIIIKI